jgi:organic radical activating enzyme
MNKIYKKHDSFISLKGKYTEDYQDFLKKFNSILKNVNFEKYNQNETQIINNIKRDILSNDITENNNNLEKFNIKQNVIDEIKTIEDKDLLRYLIHRYRYEIFPQKKILDDYPPYLQIEPSSVCNYRCIFCFMTDKSFNKKSSGHMGHMSLELFKEIIDQIEGKVEFLSLASRGEPMISPQISEMLRYTVGKFLNLKINTNASLLNEEKIHAILSGGVKTLVISADAADKDLYKKLRVNGQLDKVLKNLELFNEIKEKNYSKSKIITRVSGVKFSDDQKFDDMKKFWGGLVDQVAFVDYNPWENNYDKEKNNIMKPCSDLWRRMFIWWDGKTNPCDVDYKSNLSVGVFPKQSIGDLWNSSFYNNYRKLHIDKKRANLVPCGSCSVV